MLRLSSSLPLPLDLAPSDYRYSLAALSADDFPEDTFAAVLVEDPFVDDDTFADNASGAEPSLAEVSSSSLAAFFRLPLLSSLRLRSKSRFLFVACFPLVEVFFS